MTAASRSCRRRPPTSSSAPVSGSSCARPAAAGSAIRTRAGPRARRAPTCAPAGSTRRSTPTRDYGVLIDEPVRAMSGVFVGVDVGGTFTDVVVAVSRSGMHDRQGSSRRPTTRVDGILRAVGHALTDAGAEAARSHPRRARHDAGHERRPQRTGARVALVTTDGFGDLLRLGREARVEEDRYDLLFTPAPPLVDPDVDVRGRRARERRGRGPRRARPTTSARRGRPPRRRRAARRHRGLLPALATPTPRTSSGRGRRCRPRFPDTYVVLLVGGLARGPRVRAGDDDHGRAPTSGR